MPLTRPCVMRSAAAGVLASLLLLVGSVLASGFQRGGGGAVTVPLARTPDAVAVDSRTGRIFVADDTGAVLMLALAQARLLGTVVSGHGAPLAALALALDPTTHHLFVAERGDTLAPSVVQMLDSRSGARLATIRVGHAASALAVDARHTRVFVANAADGSVSVLDARTGTLLHTTPVGLLPLALAVDARTGRAFVLGPALPGVVALPAEGGGAADLLGVLDARSGGVLRILPVGSGADALAVDARTARVFVANSSAGTVSVRSAYDGTLRRTVTVGGHPSALAVNQRRGRVYVINADSGTLSVLDAARGTRLYTLRVDPIRGPVYPPLCTVAVDEGRDQVYVTTWGGLEPTARGLTLRGSGTLTVLDARTGGVRRRMAVGVAPMAVALAEGRGQVVVVNGGGVVAQPADEWLAWGARRLQAWLPRLGWIRLRAPGAVRMPGSVSVIAAGA